MSRSLFVTSLALTTVVLLVAMPVTAAGGKGYGTPAGTWFFTADFEANNPDPPPDTFPFQLAWLQNFNTDGRTLVLLPFGEGHPNEGDGRVGCMGEWAPRRGDGHTFDLTMRCNYSQAPEGLYGFIRGIMTMLDKDTLQYEFSYVDYLADGTLLYEQGWGVATGTRIKIEPLP